MLVHIFVESVLVVHVNFGVVAGIRCDMEFYELFSGVSALALSL